MAFGAERGLALMEAPELAEALRDYRWYHSGRAELLRRMGRRAEAMAGFAMNRPDCGWTTVMKWASPVALASPPCRPQMLGIPIIDFSSGLRGSILSPEAACLGSGREHHVLLGTSRSRPHLTEARARRCR